MSALVYLPRIENGDVLQILYKITPQDARVSFEAFRLYNDASRLVLKDFVISEGRYTIRDVLERIHAATGAVTWTVGPDKVRVKVRISGEFPDPMDTKVPSVLAGRFTAPEVVAWLNKQIPDLKMHAEDVILGGRSPWVPFDLSIQPGTSVRGVLDTLACKMNMGWGAEVYSGVQEMQATIKGESPPKPHVVFGPRIRVRFGEFGWKLGPKIRS